MINMNVNTRGIDMKNDNVNNDNETKSSDLTFMIIYKPSQNGVFKQIKSVGLNHATTFRQPLNH